MCKEYILGGVVIPSGLRVLYLKGELKYYNGELGSYSNDQVYVRLPGIGMQVSVVHNSTDRQPIREDDFRQVCAALRTAFVDQQHRLYMDLSDMSSLAPCENSDDVYTRYNKLAVYMDEHGHEVRSLVVRAVWNRMRQAASTSRTGELMYNMRSLSVLAKAVAG